MIKIIFSLFIMMGLAINAFAYRVEINIDANLEGANVRDENGFIEESEGKLGANLEGEFYFDDVKTDKGPLEEAAFLSKSGSIRLATHYKGDYSGLANRFDAAVYGQSTTLAARGVINDYIIIGAYDYGKLKTGNAPEKIRQTKLALGVGKYLTNNSTITVSYFHILDTRDYGLGLGVNYRDDKGFDVAYKQFMPFESGQSLSYGGNIALANSDVFGAGASGIRTKLNGFLAYYPNKYWTLRTDLNYENLSDGDYKYKRENIDLLARYYIFESFSMHLNAGYTNGKDELGTVKGGDIGLGFRFRF